MKRILLAVFSLLFFAVNQAFAYNVSHFTNDDKVLEALKVLDKAGAEEVLENLDEKSEREIFTLLKKLAEEGKCVIVVSHSSEIKNYADKVYILDKGKLEGENE